MRPRICVWFGIALAAFVTASRAAEFQVGDLVFPTSYPMNIKLGTRATTAVTATDYLTVLTIRGEWLWVESRSIFDLEESAKGWIKARNVNDLDAQVLRVNSLIERDPTQPAPYLLAGLYCRLSDDAAYIKQAISYYSRAIAVAPADDSVYQLRAYCWSRLEKYDLAIKDMETAVSLNPNDQDYVAILNLYREQGQYANGTVIPAPPAPVAIEGLEPSA